MPTQKNSESWDLQLGFNSAFKRLTEYAEEEINGDKPTTSNEQTEQAYN